MKKRNSLNNQGFLLLTVIVLIMALTVIVIGFMSISVSQITSSQSIIDSIKAGEEAKGFAYRYHAGRLSNTAMPFLSAGISEVSDEKTFTSSITIQTSAAPNQTDRYRVTTTY